MSSCDGDVALHRRPRGLTERLREALNLYPCELLCIHRDAEREQPVSRRDEIATAIEAVAVTGSIVPPAVCIIPVRMQEAWLLFDEAAIRSAAGNPNGRQTLELPQLARIEQVPDPKEMLRGLLRQASGLSRRRLERLDDRPHRVADFIDDFTPLRTLAAFQAFETELGQTITAQGWDRGEGEMVIG